MVTVQPETELLYTTLPLIPRNKSRLLDLFRHAKASHCIEDGLSVAEAQFLPAHEQGALVDFCGLKR